MKPRHPAASEVSPGCGVLFVRGVFRLREASLRLPGRVPRLPARSVSPPRKGRLRPSELKSCTANLTTLEKPPSEGGFPLSRPLSPLASPFIPWYSNLEGGRDSLSGISGPVMGDHGIWVIPGRDGRFAECLHEKPPSGGPGNVFGGKRFPETTASGGMHDMDRFSLMPFFVFS